ncbi:MAG: hypothetical protein P8R42_25225 [Candidatus Binatia bacterium]|nr:hypothetical protein [Candidatus Binatia bacterium]
MTAGTGIGEPGTESAIGDDVTGGVRTHPRADSLVGGELALGKLSIAPDRTGWISLDQVDRGSSGEGVTVSGANLFIERLLDLATGDAGWSL